MRGVILGACSETHQPSKQTKIPALASLPCHPAGPIFRPSEGRQVVAGCDRWQGVEVSQTLPGSPVVSPSPHPYHQKYLVSPGPEPLWVLAEGSSQLCVSTRPPHWRPRISARFVTGRLPCRWATLRARVGLLSLSPLACGAPNTSVASGEGTERPASRQPRSVACP